MILTPIHHLGELKKNKWGEIELNRDTLQTGVANIFAAGDAVTGPDTIIGAISQAKIASDSCHQYLSGEPVKQKDKIFISRRDNFRQPGKEDLPQRFAHRPRETMPSLDPSQRDSFSEVELGYPMRVLCSQKHHGAWNVAVRHSLPVISSDTQQNMVQSKRSITVLLMPYPRITGTRLYHLT